MRQYLAIKENYRDCILFFRMGDFYEMFFEDAVTASRVLEITLTSRNKGKEDSIPLCGIPYHAASSYIAKLIENGFKVAICEQVEDPKQAKGIVKREVVRVVTPGLVLDSDTLEAKEHNFLAALSFEGAVFGLAFIDISTGDFWVTESDDREHFLYEVAGFGFREVLISAGLKDKYVLKMFSQELDSVVMTQLSPDYFSSAGSLELLTTHFSDERVKEINFPHHPAMTSAAGAVLRYVMETQGDSLAHINDIHWYNSQNYLVLDSNAKRNLELFTTIQDRKRQGSLIHVIDTTETAMGGRRLRWWLNYPLTAVREIRERLAAVSRLREDNTARRSIRDVLSHVYDLERLGSRISMGLANARDLVALKESLTQIPEIKALISEMESTLLVSILNGLDELPHIVALLEQSIVSDPPMTIREGNMIRQGFDAELDELMSIGRDGKKGIAALEAKERERTGINTLKVGFNSVFGYYIEVTKSNTHLVPDHYVRKQTLVNAERYINEELKEYEYKVLNAEDKRKEKEYELFVELRNRAAFEIRTVQRNASLLADLDALVSLAEVAERYNYCCPEINDEDRIEIEEGRHPVVERMELRDGFVPNDVSLDCTENRFLIITGPNMAGKSTYIRQVAVIVLLAQIGSYVPAATAKIGVVDRIFTRVGAADSLARGQSTFMVEMNEVATILHNATSKSLILLDEVGRGTSTFDGLSIAWAVAEYIHDEESLGARTLFATHYHELTDMVRTKEGVKNYSISVKEWGDRIIFIRNIVHGGTNRSYGIQVARLAGVPNAVIERAKEVLANLEKGELDDIGMPKIARGKRTHAKKDTPQLPLFLDDEDRIISELRNADVSTMTPLEALNRLSTWKERLNRKE